MTDNAFEVVLIGDTGEIRTDGSDQVMQLFSEQLPSTQNSLVIFLGDLIYPKGLPSENDPARKPAEKILDHYHTILKDFKGKKLFISGNHDWNKGKPDGYEYVLRQEEYIQQLFSDKEIYQPRNGCPGPAVIDVNEQLAVIVINTQWWLQDGFKPSGKQFGCCVENEQQFFAKLNNALYKNKHKQLLVIGHTPVYSYSVHGGRYKLRHHLFPLTIYKKNAWLPLPVLGSLLPLYRKLYGAKEDITHPRYRRLRAKLKLIFKRYPGLIYACGHEHNLQYIEKNRNHFIVSGSGSKVKYVVQNGKYLRFGAAKKGFFKLKLQNQQIKCECWAINSKYEEGRLFYSDQLK